MALAAALENRTRFAEKLAIYVRNMHNMLYDATGAARMPTTNAVRRRLNIVITGQAEFNDSEDKYLRLLSGDDVARTAKLAYVDTIN